MREERASYEDDDDEGKSFQHGCGIILLECLEESLLLSEMQKF